LVFSGSNTISVSGRISNRSSLPTTLAYNSRPSMNSSAMAGWLEILPLTEMVFDPEKTKPEERIATQYAKWDEPYRERRGIRNQFARRISKAARATIEETARTAYRALWLRDYARLDIRLTARGEVWFIEANANPFISYGHDVASAAVKAGMNYYAFIQRIVDEAMARYEQA
jgi:D-alanine-D-alanine ligase